MPSMLSAIGILSHLVAAIGFAALGLALALRRAPTGFRIVVVLAAFCTAFWAGSHAMSAYFGLQDQRWLSQLETVRTAAWIAVLVVLQRRSWGLDERPSSSFVVAALLGFVVALQLALDTLFDVSVSGLPLQQQGPAALLFIATRLLLAISGLVLLHNLYVNARNQTGLSFRLFTVGLGVIFLYDLNLYTLHFLTGAPNVALLGVRGAVNALAIPLLYLAMRGEGEGRFHLSRNAAFQTVSFTMIGLYLIVMSVLAYGLKITGGNWGELLQVVFLAITMIGGALVMLSPRFRAEVKVRIAQNFYRYRYDYRVEWLRFIDTIDAQASDLDQQPIRERLIEAVATVLDCPGGAILEPSDAGGFELVARWGWPDLEPPPIAEGAALTLFFAEEGRIVDFDMLREESDRTVPLGSHGSLTLPEWAAADSTIWLAVPLIRRDFLTGILLLHRSIAPRALNWEDYDLLRTLGRQGASYIAEAETQAKLDEAKSFEDFNRRFAFVMHDLKNVVSQLGLVARNAERHAHNPEFRDDMVATLNASVTKMSDLLKLMGRETGERAGGSAAGDGLVDIGRTMTLVAAALRRQHVAIELDGVKEGLLVRGDDGRLEAMLTHLVQNAVDASAPDAPIRLTLAKSGTSVRLVVADHGHGMSKSFIKDELFKPFRSTKDGGYGIGAYEAREIVRAHGGRMQVDSRPG